MPWEPRYSAEQAQRAVGSAATWREAAESLGLSYHGKNLANLRKWCARWGVDFSHLGTRPSVTRHRYTEADARAAIAAARSWAEALRRLGYCHSGANPKTLKKRAAQWGISTDHFDRYAGMRAAARRRQPPLEEVLVENSTYTRHCLKRRLFETGLKTPECELCGQDELWQGKRIGLILDHINGVRDDNRLENLRIVCPNCAATLDTHCGRKNRIPLDPRACARCGVSFTPNAGRQRYCSRECGTRWDRSGRNLPGARGVERPPRDQLLAEIHEFGYLATGRKYGVSDNAIRKWVRAYERELALTEGRDPDVVKIPTRTWPRRRRDRR